MKGCLSKFYKFKFDFFYISPMVQRSRIQPFEGCDPGSNPGGAIFKPRFDTRWHENPKEGQDLFEDPGGAIIYFLRDKLLKRRLF